MFWGKQKKLQNFFHSNKKEITKIDIDGNKSADNIFYKIKYIDSMRLTTTYQILLIISQKEFIKLNFTMVIESVQDNLIKYKCLSCYKGYLNKIDEKSKKKFKNMFKFSNNDINKFILLLGKAVYPYEYMDDWEKFYETTLPEKEKFYSCLNMEDITDADYMYRKSLQRF